ncbi:MAG: DNA mismatch repair endonuclease MutL [Treponema sp.]
MIAAMYKPVKPLDTQTARKIAAGEVIDRPAAVIRELLDNAIDSGATKIEAEIIGGGVDCIRVRDNGCGMTKEDLAICTDTHTTSKIETAEDLLALRSLGFRGEALSSIKAVSDLEITSTREGPAAWKLQLGTLVPARLNTGTVVQVERLFENFPARKQFLKRASAETNLCRTIFLDKALPHHQTEMRFIIDGKERFTLLSRATLRERCLDAFSFKEPDELFFQIEHTTASFSFSAVLGSPDVIRSDKRAIFIFVNGRRISEFGLVQAVEYGSEGYFPNGGHPVAFIFLTVDPARVDFNIHPAKKEARFQDYGEIHHAISSTVAAFYRQHTVATLLQEKYTPEMTAPLPFSASEIRQQPEYAAWSERNRRYGEALAQKEAGFSFGKPVPAASIGTQDAASRYCNPYTDSQQVRESPITNADSQQIGEPRAAYGRFCEQILPPPVSVYSTAPFDIPPADFKLLGQVAGTFIAVEKNDALYLIDQHAAHERIIFEQLKQNTGGSQELLVPYRIITESPADDALIRLNKNLLLQAGFTVVDEGCGVWQVTAVPARWVGTEQDLAADITDAHKHAGDILDSILASAACRAACKDGFLIDPASLHRLAAQTFALPEPLCPHGRPLWITLTREELFKRIRRT